MQARAIPDEGGRNPRPRPRMRTPIAALLLTTLASLSPTLALAPLNASEPATTAAVPLDAGDAPGGRGTRGHRSP